MKAATLVLALSIAAVQSVSAADCCCIFVCKHQDQSCSDCDHKTAPDPKPKKDDC